MGFFEIFSLTLIIPHSPYLSINPAKFLKKQNKIAKCDKLIKIPINMCCETGNIFKILAKGEKI